jgi:tRNA(Arg) A34 adenosine deaminase TadA
VKAHYARVDVAVYDAETAKDRRWIRQTLGLAATSQHSFPMGAIAVLGGRVVAQAVNRRRNSPMNVPWPACSFHAEESLVRTRPELHGATVYVARLTAAGVPGLARPCLRCHDLLTAAGVRRTVWTAPGGMLGVETYDRL